MVLTGSNQLELALQFKTQTQVPRYAINNCNFTLGVIFKVLFLTF